MTLDGFHILCDSLPKNKKGCQIWPQAVDRGGYPLVGIRGKKYRGNRVRLKYKLGRELLPEMNACHTCDNPSCVALEHLFEGTADDNSKDMVAKGRSNASKGKDHYAAKDRTLKGASQKDIQRFFSYVEILSNGCWFWTGARSRGKGNKKWYGSFHYDGKTVRAHRFSCEQIKGDYMRSWEQRDHLCRFSLCVNPEHFEVVDKDENQRRSRLPLPPVQVCYFYNEQGDLQISLKVRANLLNAGFTPAENEPILSDNVIGEVDYDKDPGCYPFSL